MIVGCRFPSTFAAVQYLENAGSSSQHKAGIDGQFHGDVVVDVLAVALPPTVAADDCPFPALDHPLKSESPLPFDYPVSLREAFGRVAWVGRMGGRHMGLWLRHGGPSLRNE